jgi:hypothetical protein
MDNNILVVLNNLVPVFVFVVTFIIVFSALAKAKILMDNNIIYAIIAFIFAGFLMLNARMINFVQINVAWGAVFMVCLFLVMLLLAFTQGNASLIVKPGFAWAFVIFLFGFFVYQSMKIFNWSFSAVKADALMHNAWFGFFLLIVVAIGVSFVLIKG